MQPSTMTLATLTAASAGANGADISMDAIKAMQLVIDITTLAGTAPTLTVTVQGKDPVSGKYYTILASTALNATGTTVLRIGVGLPVTANLSANDFMPRTWRIVTAIGGSAGQAVTATISANILPDVFI